MHEDSDGASERSREIVQLGNEWDHGLTFVLLSGVLCSRSIGSEQTASWALILDRDGVQHTLGRLARQGASLAHREERERERERS